jgi:hypothetical protein
LGDLVGYRIKDLEKELKEVVRLRRDAAWLYCNIDHLKIHVQPKRMLEYWKGI